MGIPTHYSTWILDDAVWHSQSLFSDILTCYVSIKFIEAAMRFKSITCSDCVPVKIWIGVLVF